MQLDYAGKRVNILIHQARRLLRRYLSYFDGGGCAFVMVVDSAKGIEAQTKKLFEVVKHRYYSLFTFINKLDRDGREPLDLLQELEEVLGIASYPMNWPIGMGKLEDSMTFTINVWSSTVVKSVLQVWTRVTGSFGSNPFYAQVLDDIELLAEAGNEFSGAGHFGR